LAPMIRDSRFERLFRWIVALTALAIALSALRYALTPWNVWLGVDDGIRAVFARANPQMLTHVLVAPIALVVGAPQFFPSIRTRHPSIHRWVGRIYVLACVLAGCAALGAAPFASGGPVASVGFGLLAVGWIGTTLWGWRAAVARKFLLHRLLMRFSYAFTFAAVTLRVQIPLGFLLFHFASYPAMSVWLAYISWIPNVLAVALFSFVVQRRKLHARGA